MGNRVGSALTGWEASIPFALSLYELDIEDCFATMKK
jgi:hypothetical protein